MAMTEQGGPIQQQWNHVIYEQTILSTVSSVLTDLSLEDDMIEGCLGIIRFTCENFSGKGFITYKMQP
jgi:hypothetical protein